MGYSWNSFYRLKELYEQGGELTLQEISRRKPIFKNRIDTTIEDLIVALAIDNPALCEVKVSNKLKKKEFSVSAGGVCSIWLKHNLQSFQLGLKALEAKVAQEGYILTEPQLIALEKAKEEKVAHGEIKNHQPCYLGAQDIYYVGNIKGAGHIYQQTFIAIYSKVIFTKLYDRKNALMAGNLLNDQVVHFFDEHQLRLLHVLTDKG